MRQPREIIKSTLGTDSGLATARKLYEFEEAALGFFNEVGAETFSLKGPIRFND